LIVEACIKVYLGVCECNILDLGIRKPFDDMAILTFLCGSCAA